MRSRVNSTLQRLELGGNSLGSTGGIAIAGALMTNTSLLHLELENNGLRAEGIGALAEALRHNTTLVHLGANMLSFAL